MSAYLDQIAELEQLKSTHAETWKGINAEYAVRKLIKSGALPVMLGGDHAVHIPCIR
ncbi:MAG: arginase family protein, partial [Pseudomonadales bacterium]